MSKQHLGQQGLATLRARFLTLAPREQKLVLLMSLVVGAALLWVWFSWQIKENARLDRALPQARAQLASMQDASAEITRLRAKSRLTPATGKALLDNLQAAARAQQLNLDIHSVENGWLQVSGTAISFDAWINWLAQVQGNQGLVLSHAGIVREARGVRIEAQLTTGR